MSYARFVTRRFRQRGESRRIWSRSPTWPGQGGRQLRSDYGTTFLTYATPIITGEIKRHFRDTTWICTCARMQELSATVRAAQEELTQRMGTSPSARDVAFFLDLPLDEVVDAYEAVAAYHTASLDVPVALPDGTAPPSATCSATTTRHRPGVDREALKPLLERLTGREKRILLMRFFRNMSQAEIGVELGVSQMQVSAAVADPGAATQRLA